LRFASCALDLERWELRRDGRHVALEPRAMSVLRELIEHRERVVTKEELLDRVWGDRFVSESALTTQIKELRRAVGDTGRRQAVVRTVHGLGYLFVAPVEGDEGGPAPPLDGAELAQHDAGLVVAVLPFLSVSDERTRAHVSDGLTSDLVMALSKHPSIRVLGRATSCGYLQRADPTAALRDELGVGHVIDGTVRIEESRVRVTVTLTDSASGICRWADRYDRNAADAFAVLDEIADSIVGEVVRRVDGSATA
jgi:TolB-like protein